MTLLMVGLAAFFGTHVLSTLLPLRSRLVAGLGENTYKALYSVMALAGLVMIVMGYARAPLEIIYQPPDWGRQSCMLLSFLAVLLIVAAYAPNNLKRITAHPMLWGTFFWAMGHLLVRGDTASLLLFGSFGVYALYDMCSANQRGQRPSKEKHPLIKDLTVIALGLIVYAILFRFHGSFFGVTLG